MPLIEIKDVLSGCAFKSPLISSTSALFILFPKVICLWPCCIPVIKDFEIWMLLTNTLGEFGDAWVPQGTD
jgi:hypothetical protein